MTDTRRWDRSRAADLTDLVAEALPGEELMLTTLIELCWDDPDPCVVIGSAPEGDAVFAGAAVVRPEGDRLIGFVRLLAVAPAHRRAGLGASLLIDLETWARHQGAVELRLGGEAPHYLWPGVDLDRTAALCLAEAAGYLDRGAALNLGCATGGPLVAPPEGIRISRVVGSDPGQDEIDLARVLVLVRAEWPWWEPEVLRAAGRNTCLAAVISSGDVVALGCHGANRPGWFGPIGTDPAREERGVGTALLTAVLADMAAGGHANAEISWIGPVRFYAKAVGATVSHAYRTLIKPA